MAREQDGGPPSGFCAQYPRECLDCDWVQAGKRLVEDEQLRLMQQGGGKLYALLISVGEFLDLRARTIVEAEPLKPPGRCCARRTVVQPVQSAEVCELLAYRHSRVEPTLLRHVSEPKPLGQPDRLPVPENLAGVGPNESEDGTHRSRLPGSVRTEEAEHSPALNRERAAVERLVLLLTEPLAYVDEG